MVPGLKREREVSGNVFNFSVKPKMTADGRLADPEDIRFDVHLSLGTLVTTPDLGENWSSAAPIIIDGQSICSGDYDGLVFASPESQRIFEKEAGIAVLEAMHHPQLFL